MGVIFLCSGQGMQHPAMFARLAQEPAAAPVLDAASQHLGVDVRRLEENPGALEFSDNLTAQLLITAHALGVNAALTEQRPEICLGYSVGEIAACACAGAITADAAFELIRHRARCMDAAREAGAPQGMLAVIGIPVAALGARLEGADTEIAIVNGPDHAVIGGMDTALDALESSLPAQGARNIRRLSVRVASHTRFMDPAAEAFAPVLEAMDWRTPRISLLSGVDGRPIRSKADAVTALTRQLRETLNFHRALESAREHGATCALEIGPGRSLTRMFDEAFPDVPARAFEDFRSAAGAQTWLGRQAAS
jgi:[acyl-carrier-protein] S-malonyltransferase